MLEIIYRINKVVVEEDDYGCRRSHEVAMEILIIESRDKFKQLMKDLYGQDLKFANSGSLKDGDIFCTIIGEHAFEETKERYFNKKEFICSHCGKHTTCYIGNEKRVVGRVSLPNPTKHYADKLFCSLYCVSLFEESERKKIQPDESFEWIGKDSFVNSYGNKGYIYKITKKSSGEFYVGQTAYMPIFRWGQHLKTERFYYDNIIDYQFEVIEVVSKDKNILEVEKYWIEKLWKENPTKSLNISNTKKL